MKPIIHKLLLLPVWLIATGAFCQTGEAPERDTASFVQQEAIATGVVQDFAVDNLGNLYVLTQAGYLKKMNARGDSLNVFNDIRRYGVLSLMDVTNPMRLVLYYKDFSTVVVLDRFLNQLHTVDLRKAGVFQAKAVGLSYDNHLWVYDEQAAKLKKIDDEGKLVMETTDLRQVLTVMPSPDRLVDRDGFVYLYDTEKGLYVFDYYGMLKNELPLPGIAHLQVLGSTVVGIADGKFIRYTLGDIHVQELRLPAFMHDDSRKVISRDGIYVYRDRQIIRYDFR